MFSGCPSVSACVPACVRACVLLARYLINRYTEFYQTLVDDVVQAPSELKGQGQGR